MHARPLMASMPWVLGLCLATSLSPFGDSFSQEAEGGQAMWVAPPSRKPEVPAKLTPTLYQLLLAAGEGRLVSSLPQLGRSILNLASQDDSPTIWPWLATFLPRYQIPQWMKRVDLDLDFQGNEGPIYSLRTRQPLFQSSQNIHTLFTQIRWGKIYQLGSWRDTTNIGLGYRRLFRKKTILLGVNTFFDRDWRKDHNRIGVGLEARWFGADLYVNGYWGISGDNSITTSTKEKVLDGWDAYMLLQAPYVPSVRFVGRVFQWNKSVGTNWYGWRAGIEADLTPYTQLQAGATDSNQDRLTAFIQLRINFGYYANRPVLFSAHPISTHAWRMRDMSGYTLDRVRRQENIVVERVTTAGGGAGTITVVVGRS
ncbi:MAG: hypothetical protein D6704_13425 [Nitrospirae bacterium]|nr:MAG: hypothetical protein D6704_13425 [Nitrospirota bacterium]